MMTKHLSITSFPKKGLVIPILTALVFSFCTKVAQTKSAPKEVPTKTSLNYLKIITKNHFEVKDESGK
jgi:hypothetical protein